LDWGIAGAEPSRRCPVAQMLDVWDVFRSWEWLQRGVMPAPGGWTDQSPVWIELMEVVAACRPKT